VRCSRDRRAHPLWRKDPTKPRIPCGSNEVKGNIMIIGNFKRNAKADTYTGDVSTLTFNRDNVQLTPNAKSNDKEPDYRIVAKAGTGTVEFGAAWKRTSERGQDFLSVSIDDPALPGSLNAALFTAEDGESATLVWTRPKSKPKAKAA
jgi:uncharacterized protein (DUF736 family)